MNAALAGATAAAVCGGIVLVVAGLTVRPRLSTGVSTGLWRAVDSRVRNLSPRARRRWTVGLVGGVAAGLVSGWVVLVVVVPALVVGLPVLLGDPPERDLELARALERWVRLVAASAATGKSVLDAVRATRAQAPEELAEPLAALVARLDSRWQPAAALRAFADELDSADADQVVASLVLAVEFGGTGAPATLVGLAGSLQERTRALREISTERTRPRIVARQVSAIVAVVAAGAVLLGRDFLAPYATAPGQVLLGLYVAMYTGSLVVLARRSSPRRRERILVGAGHATATGGSVRAGGGPP